MESTDLEKLKERIIKNYGSVYAFAKRNTNGLAKSTIYQVLSGKYSGDAEKQIRIILSGLGENTNLNIAALLKETACARCRRKNPRQRQCEKCNELCRAQSEALMRRLEKEK